MRALVSTLACAFATGASAAQSSESPQPALPTVPAGFAVDLIGEAPEILWPSAVHCLDDGSLLLAEDRMDMPGPTDQPLDKLWLLRWNEDGLTYARTLFCDRLFATFGLQQIDDAVYVMNMPHLTVLRDRDGDGVAEERTELLTDLGPPAPGWPGGFNDHIVSGIRLGMDGFLYIAVGDKGIPLAHGTDGRTLSLRGGGVVRVRPDGSGLEIVASGLRNILDVAIDERGEMFTYDNTDDGLGWWTRLTHVIPGGYYGYPWDYQEHSERMLPCMADYGGGSPCGGLVYREAAWPPPYRGSLFFCEWAKSALRRFELEPDGATFKVKLAEDFMTAGEVKEFRPLDVCESPDGRFLYLTDWAYGGWTANVEAGRLWRIRRSDDSGTQPGGLASIPADLAGRLKLLDSPSFRMRLATQRTLIREDDLPSHRRKEERLWAWRGEDPLAVFGPGLSERGRRHLIWTLAELERIDSRRGFGLNFLSWVDRSEPTATLVQHLLASKQGWGVSLEEMWCLDSPELAVRREAARLIQGFENSHDERAFEQVLADALEANSDPTIRWNLRSNLRRNGRAAEIVKLLADAPTALRQELLLACEERFEIETAIALAELASTAADPGLRAEILRVLSGLHRQREPWDGKWWSIQPAKTPPPPKVVEWEGTPVVAGAVEAALADPAAEVRRAALRCVVEMPERALLPQLRARWAAEGEDALLAGILDALAELKDADAGPLLEGILRDPSVSAALRERAVKVAAAIGTDEMGELLCAAASAEAADPELIVTCLEALGRMKLARAEDPVRGGLRHADERVRSASCAALAEIAGPRAESALIEALADESVAVRQAAVEALGALKLAASVPALLAMLDSEDTRSAAILALARRPDEAALEAYLAGLDEKELAARSASRTALARIRESVRPRVEELASARRLSPLAIAELQKLYRTPQPVIGWKLLGPFPREAAPALEGAPIDFERRWPGADGELAWTDHAAEPAEGFVDLERAFASRSEVCAFAACTLESAREREVEIAAGSDDMLAVWVNGELVHEFAGNRAWSADADRFTARLRKGPNALLLRIGQGVGQWSFNFKISGDEGGPLFETEVAAPSLEDYRAFALTREGAAVRGAQLFRDPKGALCIRCHTVSGEGEKVGPDLTDVGAKYAREELIESVLRPSQRIAEGYRAVTVILDDEERFFGQIRAQDAREVVLVDTSGKTFTFDRSEIAEIRESPLSVMPDGLAMLLTTQEFADLVAYLESLKGAAAR